MPLRARELIPAGELAQLSPCEQRLVLSWKYGRLRTEAQERKAEEGRLVHARAHDEAVAQRARQDRRCFIATTVLGEHHPDTAALRRFRDRALAPRRAGRFAIAAYYRISPPIARWLSRRPKAASAVRRGLAWFVRKVIHKEASHRDQ